MFEKSEWETIRIFYLRSAKLGAVQFELDFLEILSKFCWKDSWRRNRAARELPEMIELVVKSWEYLDWSFDFISGSMEGTPGEQKEFSE